MLIDSLVHRIKSKHGRSTSPSAGQSSEGDGEVEEDESFENFEEPYRAPAYPYRELGENDVRLLRILPGTGNIECILHQMPLTEARYFFALSYVWGDLTQTETIMLEGQPFQVTKNLYEALHQFRQRPYDIGHPKDYFWIDAVCINQEDLDERSLQVSRMMEIYHAGLVVVWLGPIVEPPQESRFKRLIRGIRPSRPRMSRESAIQLLFEKATSMWTDWEPMDDDDNIIADEEFGDAYYDVRRAMIWFLCRPWFTRVWTIQEACLDAVPRFYVGRHSLHSSSLFDIFDILAAEDHSLYLTSGGKRMVSFKLIRRLYHCIGTGRDDDPQKLELAEILWDLFRFTSGKQSGDPRDQIYGLLGLLRHVKPEELPPELAPNYRLPYSQIYWDYTAFLFQSLGNLELLDCRRNELQDVPSWVVDFRYLALGSKKKYAPMSVSHDKKILHLRGHMLGTFRDVVNGCSSADLLPGADEIPAELSTRLNIVERRILRPSADIRGITVEEIFEELVKDVTRVIDEDGIESFYQVYCRLSRSSGGKRSWYAKRKYTVNMRLKEEAVADRFSSPFLLLADGTILRLTREDANVEKSDIVCIFKGGLNPSLVRSSGKNYTFLGECKAESGPLKKQEFDDDFWTDRDVQDFMLI